MTISRADPKLLTCWKDIADYMGKGVRTVQRWEQTLDLPVRRPKGNSHKGSVEAHPKDLDAWLASRWSRRGPQRNIATITDVLATADLGTLIQISRNLRRANRQLAHEVRAALAAVIESCAEMARLRSGEAQENAVRKISARR